MVENHLSAMSGPQRCLLLVAFACAAGAGVAWSLTTRSDPQRADYRPVAVADADYVSSSTCRACHPAQYDSWHASYHRSMTQAATPAALLTDLEGQSISGDGKVYRFSRRGDSYWVNSYRAESHEHDVKEPPLASWKIVMTTGSHHMQLYWIPTTRGRELALLPFAYLRREQRWVPRNAAFLRDPHWDARERDYWSAEVGRWNHTCIKCHATHGRVDVTGDDDVLETRVAELGIACEACHGPGRRHGALNRNPARRYGKHLSGAADHSVVDPARLPPDRSAAICGQCHSVNFINPHVATPDMIRTGDPFRPGEALQRTRYVVQAQDDQLMRADGLSGRDFFWPDGMVCVTGREYNALIQTPCYTHGDPARMMTCLSCHQMHKPVDDPRKLVDWADDQLALDMREDKACLQCHAQYEGAARLEAHTHHGAASAGSRCYNCHMPHTTYGLLKAIRSHLVDSPTVAATLQTGRPNACNQCHLDRTLDWTARQMNAWYGQPIPQFTADQREVASSVLMTLKGDATQRSLMAWSFGWSEAHEASGTDWMAPYLAQLLIDPYEAVRFIAHRSLKRLPGFAGFTEYDFVGPPDRIRAARERVIDMWRSLPGSPPGPQHRRPLLIDASGRLRSAEIARLLQARDHRSVNLQE